jgi:hypothetical protein
MRKKPTDKPVAERSLDHVNGRVDRRTFVKTGGALLVGSVVACDSEGSGPTARGTVSLTLIGLHDNATTGGRITATPTTGGTQVIIDIPATPQHSRDDVPAGTYSVSYSPPEHHIVAPGSPIPSVITVDPDNPIAFTIALQATGNIQVSVAGLSGASGGSASAQRTDAAGAAVPVALSAAGQGSAAVPVGTYSVTYTAPNGFSVTSNNPMTGIAVDFAETEIVAFTVQSSTPTETGGLRVVVSGLTGATSGGSVSARLTNNTGNTFTANLSTPASGSAEATIASMPVGTYNVTYTAPAGYSLTSGQQNPRQATVVANTTTDVPTFTAQQNPAPTGLLWASDWSTAVGNTANAVGDGGLWENIFNAGTNLMDVVAATGLGFPGNMANALRIHCVDPAPGLMYGNGSPGWGAPGVGDHRYFRCYWRNSMQSASSPDPTFHFFLPAPNTGAWAIQSNLGATYFLRFAVDFPPQHQWGPSPNLTRDVVYRLEWHMHRTGNNTFTFEARIYDAADALVASTDQLQCNGLGNHTAHTGTAGTYTLADANDFNGYRGIRLAWEGGGGGHPSTPSDVVYLGGFAVSAADWCGPYVPGQRTSP